VNMTDQQSRPADARPTIVLVHGAYADASSWNGVIERLLQQGYTVIAPANPLRGKKLPSWAVVATGDKAAGTDAVRSQAQQAGADIVEVEGSHVIMISQPQAVTDHILKAVRAVAAAPR
jgi:alpha-beta hydrolase superfamily lysophospholipase